jgi:hypothetical protein
MNEPAICILLKTDVALIICENDINRATMKNRLFLWIVLGAMVITECL